MLRTRGAKFRIIPQPIKSNKVRIFTLWRSDSSTPTRGRADESSPGKRGSATNPKFRVRSDMVMLNDKLIGTVCNASDWLGGALPPNSGVALLPNHRRGVYMLLARGTEARLTRSLTNTLPA